MNDTNLVSEYYNITDFEIKKLAESNNSYWLTVRDFWWQVKDRNANNISSKQAAWLSKIEDEIETNWRPKWIEEDGEELPF